MVAELVAIQAVNLLTPYLIKGGEELSKLFVKDLWDRTKLIFSSAEKSEVLSRFESAPDDLKRQGQVEYVLEEELSRDDSLLKEFESVLANAKQGAEYNSTINQSGSNNIAVGGQINNSKISINKGDN